MLRSVTGVAYSIFNWMFDHSAYFCVPSYVEETEDFKAQKTHPTTKEIFSTLASNWRIVLAGMMMSAMTTTTFYFITVYTTVYAKRTLEMSITDSLLATVFVGLSNFFWLPMGGLLSDKIGRRPVGRHYDTCNFYQLSGFKFGWSVTLVLPT